MCLVPVKDFCHKLFIVCVMLFVVTLPSMVVADDMRFKRLFTSEGEGDRESIGAVGVIVEDALGFIWIGGEYGLARYDGHDLKIYKRDVNNPFSLPRSMIRDVAFDRDGTMWIATSGGLARYLPDTDGFETVELNRPGDEVSISLDVSSLAVDRFNNLIVGTHIGFAILDPTRTQLKKFRNDQNDPASLSDDYIRLVYVDSNNFVWIGTSAGGLNRFNPNSGEFVRYLHDANNAQSLIDNDVRAVTEDHLGRIWVGTYGGGISRLVSGEKAFVNYQHSTKNAASIGANAIHDIFEDSYHTIWVATDHGGLAKYVPEKDGFEHYLHSDYDEQTMSSNHVRKVFEDSRGDLWIGNFPEGVNFYDRSSAVFHNYSHRPDDPASISDSAILSFYKDSYGVFWIGTENGLNIFNEKEGTFQRIYHNADDENALRYGTVLSIQEDEDGSMWFGTWSGGLHKYDRITGKFKNYYPNSAVPGSISSKFIWDILLDSDQTLWIGSEKGGLNRYDRDTDSFVTYRANTNDPTTIIDDNIWSMLVDRRGNMWVGTFGGLELFDRKTGVFTHFLPNDHDPGAIRGDRIMALLEDDLGRIWVATQDDGLNVYSPETGVFAHVGVDEGLPANELSTLIEDDLGNVWVSGTGGIAKVDKDSFAVQVYTKDHGLVGNNFNRDASYKDKNGNLYIGGVEGFSVFHPSQLTADLNASPIYITGMSILNRPVDSGSKDARLPQSILATKNITLGHKDSVFTFDFAVLSYRSSHQNQYAYMLEGFDRDWNYVGNRNSATYTSMDPGSYVFKVKAANRDGIWTTSPATMQIQILPPPWLSWWAYALYCGLVIMVVVFIWFAQMKRAELLREKRLNNQLIKVDRMKDAILANTSHELRTPLNSIIGIAESVCDGAAGDVSQAVKDYLQIVLNSGKRLTNLVDNILEYANLSTSPDALNRRPVDLHTTVQVVCNTLVALAKSKNIRLINEVPRAVSVIQADESRLQQVLISLIENAIKFTHSGSVSVTCLESRDSIRISITDTGQGMSEQQIRLIFDPFNSSGDDEVRAGAGAGLGLAIAKHIVEQHGGYIGVESEAGSGSTFYLVLPIDEELALKPERRAKSIAIEDNLDVFEKKSDIDDMLAHLSDPSSYTILIVDDDFINRMVLTTILSQYHFNTLEAASGFDALELLASQHQVDLVILDVMMPGLSGYETCQKLRENCSYWELPIIFLTAKKVPGGSLEGFVCGGNDFLTKPVSKLELIPRVVNQLKMANMARRKIF